jgi:phosphoribosylamine--glycine ligase
MWIKERSYAKSGRGIVRRLDSWREGLRDCELVVVDMVGMGHIEKVLRTVGKPYIGASPFMDKLELERETGMRVFAECGIAVPETHGFANPKEAREFFKDGLDFEPGWCIKADDNLGCATSRLIKDPEQLDWAFSQYPSHVPLIVQRIMEGVEVSTEGWFNGRDWIKPFNHTFEEKRLMDGGLGPQTGCMGNVVVACEGCRLTRATVEKLKPLLVKIGWRGPVDVNCIVNEEGAFGLEATARFGYDAIEALLEGVRMGAGDFLREIANGTMESMDVSREFLIGVRLAVPPYPSEDEDAPAPWGEPILGINEQNIGHLWPCNVMIEDNLFKTSGADGLTLVATARGDDLALARRRVYRTLDNLRVGGKMYRRDIGARVENDLERLRGWNWCKGNSK